MGNARNAYTHLDMAKETSAHINIHTHTLTHTRETSVDLFIATIKT